MTKLKHGGKRLNFGGDISTFLSRISELIAEFRGIFVRDPAKDTSEKLKTAPEARGASGSKKDRGAVTAHGTMDGPSATT